MTQKRYDNQGRMWANTSDNIKAPHYRGVITLDGVDYRISAWPRITEKGLVLDLKRDGVRKEGQQTGDYQMNQDDEDLPF